ncbi:MAG: type IV toxin-antitoxin system AbiEi family antitoxin [Elusimicrobiota bacterium]
MNIGKDENKIFGPCLEHLRRYLKGTKVACQRPQGPHQPGFVLTLPALKLAAECKANLATRAQARHAVIQARGRGGKDTQTFIVAKWIPETVAEELRKEGVFFIDTVGNAYLWKPPALGIDIRGKKPDQRPGPEPGRIVDPAGLKVFHLLLTDPKALRQPLRTIAERANVALGTAHIVVRELMAARYLLPGKGRERRLGDAKACIETFVRGYALKLRPACLIGRYRHRANNAAAILEAFKKRTAAAQPPVRWGLTGGMAAREMTRHLEPNTVTAFVDELAEQNLREEPMLLDRNGNVTLLRLFAPTAVEEPKPKEAPLATPLLVYAELLNEGGPRELETAEMILGKHVLPQVGG